ncbi:YybH family protein [Dokdonella ginsengisoli]|uniref:YybH family protein n=1 Tax=Dokdonella ginsengisoli TaxID=363846 RepID=A0ABV9QU83_9GAMM
MTERDDPFPNTLDAYAGAVRRKDVEAFLALYADDVLLFDLWGTWSVRGIDAWRAAVSEWFSSLGDEYVVVRAEQPASTVCGDLAVGHAILTYTAFAADGRELRSLDNRLTMALRCLDGGWKIVHEHTSAPLDHASAKAMLQRPPGA